MINKPPSPPAAESRTWFYWFLAAIGLYSLIWDALLEVDFIAHPYIAESAGNLSLVLRPLTALLLVPLVLVIAWLVWRRAPYNVVGLFLVIWSATVAGGSLRPDSALKVVGFNFTWPTVILLPFYFPDGRPSPRRFGWVIDILGALGFSSLLLTILATPPTPGNPGSLFIPGLAPLQPVIWRILGLSLTAIMLFLVPSLVLRYRAAEQRERLQMKWLALFSILFLILGTTLASAGLLDSDPNSHGPFGALILGAFYLFLALFIPLGVANAIFRHRLNNIDILIRRTLTYSTLMALAASFGVQGEVQQQVTCIDPKMQWSRARNIWYNAAIRTTLYGLTWPLRKIRRLLTRQG